MTGEARPGGVFGVDEDRALGTLVLAWGNAYEIYVVGGQWPAWREGAGDKDVLTRDTPDALNAAIRADWAREGTL